ncbi:MAG: hypothetical protein EHM20_02040 [Alphaproteobacteria bacterium]|nr:MAG: hypothetical protein EHM20_02040 [Alphaproteobacteria bacterium]
MNNNLETKTEGTEERLKAKGYELVEEMPPFRIYEKNERRVIYHSPSAKIWGVFRVGYFKEDGE